MLRYSMSLDIIGSVKRTVFREGSSRRTVSFEHMFAPLRNEGSSGAEPHTYIRKKRKPVSCFLIVIVAGGSSRWGVRTTVTRGEVAQDGGHTTSWQRHAVLA